MTSHTHKQHVLTSYTLVAPVAFVKNCQQHLLAVLIWDVSYHQCCSWRGGGGCSTSLCHIKGVLSRQATQLLSVIASTLVANYKCTSTTGRQASTSSIESLPLSFDTEVDALESLLERRPSQDLRPELMSGCLQWLLAGACAGPCIRAACLLW